MLARIPPDLALAAALLVLLAFASPTGANLLDPAVEFGDTPDQCQDSPEIPLAATLTEEIGETVIFPLDERMTRVNLAPQQGDCGIAVAGVDDYHVRLLNSTGRALQDVYIVADSGTTFDNWDGLIATNRAKFLTSTWPAGAFLNFQLMNVAPNIAPTFVSVGLSSAAAASNFNIVARPPDTDTVAPPIPLRWPALVAVALLVATLVHMSRAQRNLRPGS
jgi:hypothetical protein